LEKGRSEKAIKQCQTGTRASPAPMNRNEKKAGNAKLQTKPVKGNTD